MNNNIGLSSSSASGSDSLISSSLVTSINQIPSELLSDKSLFDSIIGDNDLWSMVDDYKKREILDKFLPKSFDVHEKEDTVRLLFNGQLKRFDDNPMDDIYYQLKLQRTSPDLLKTYEEVNQLKRRAYLIQEQKYQCKLLTEILTKRRILFEAAANSSPYGINSVTYQKAKSKLVPKNGNLGLHKRRKLLLRSHKVKERYKMEIKKLFPEDEYNTTDDDSDLELDVKPLRTESSHEDSISLIGSRSRANIDMMSSSRDEYLSMMKKFRRKRNDGTDDPTMDFSNITLKDIISRVANDSGDEIYEKILFFKNKKVHPNSSPLNSINRKKSKPSPSTATTSSTSIVASNSSQTSLSSSQLFSHNCGNVSPPKKSQSTTTLLNTNFIKREPLDIFDFDNDSPPHSFPLPPLSLSSTTSNPTPATSFSSLISRPHSPHFSSSLPNVASSSTPGTFVDFSPSSSASTIVSNTISINVTTPISTITTTTSNPLAIATLTQSSTTTPSIQPTIASFVQPKTSLPHQTQQPSPQPQQLMVKTDQTIIDPEIATQPQSLCENPPSSFFSLIRDIFYMSSSTDRKLTLHKLEELVKEKLRTIDQSKVNWSYEMVQSAMNYLSEVFPPPDMIPLVDYKEKNQLWQWIGVNRDTDDILIALCNDWLEEKDKKRTTSLMDPSQPIPPAICPTTWTVRCSSDEEKQCYRDQEALRYKKPHKAFTFTIHGYTSVVGPVKGCGVGGTAPHAASPNKAREHSLLTKDRPPFVTLLSLVRDAAARLPNGEGTRADICELLKDSQYLLPTVSEQQVNAIVSGALDRLHYEKDPCVKYDVNRKVWIYLHRNRTEEEFERLHEVQVAAAKAKRILNKTQRKSCSSSPSPSSITQTPSISTTIGNFSRINNVTNVTNLSGKPQLSAKANKSALGSVPKTGESQFETNSSNILNTTSPQQSTLSQQPQQQTTQLSSTLAPTIPLLTPVSVSSISTQTSIPTLTSTCVSTLAPTLTSVPVQTSTSTPTFSFVTSSNQQSISFLSNNAPVKASIAAPSTSTSISSSNFNSIIPGLTLATTPSSSSSGITLNSSSISTLTTTASITLSFSSTISTTTTNTLPNINLSSSSLQRLSIASPAFKKKTHRLKVVKKEPDSGDLGLTSSNLSGKPIGYSGGTMTIAPMPTSNQILPGFEKIVPNQTALISTRLESFTSLISGEKGSQVKQIRPAKSVNSTMKVTPIVTSSVANTGKNIDNVQHFLSLTTKATSNLPSNITITSSTTKPIAPKLGSTHLETQQIILPSAPGQTLFGKSILNSFEPKQPVTQIIQSSSQKQAASTVQHQILKPILPAPIQAIQSHSQQQTNQLSSTSTPTIPLLTPVSVSSISTQTSIPTLTSTCVSTLAPILTAVPVQTLTSNPTFSFVTSSNQQSISFLSNNAPVKVYFISKSCVRK